MSPSIPVSRLARLALVAAACVAAFSTPAAAADAPRAQALKAVKKIQQADYEGKRVVLQQQFDALAPLAEDAEIGSRVRYWRGFAMWRRAINGFNDGVDPGELEADLNHAIEEFEAATAADSGFVDARVGTLSSLGYLMYIHTKDPARLQELGARIGPVLRTARTAAPDNPRLIWALGPMLWQLKPEQGGGQDRAMASYERGLTLIRAGTGVAPDPLDPSWGEPELLMNLAWSQLNAATPDLDAAEKNARAALKLVPRWHYVRDILMKQIEEARTKKS